VGSFDNEVLMERARIRWVVAALAAVTAVLYFVIATEGVTVIDANDEPDVVFLIAGLLFLTGGLAMMRLDRRLYTWLFAAFDAFVIFAYFQVAVDRTPAYEVWGVTLRIPQVLLLAALLYLALRREPDTASTSERQSAVTASL